jgi:hypothetical protein
MTKTITPVKVLADLLDPTSGSYDALLLLTIEIENGVLTLGSYNGPDLWRAYLQDLTGETNGTD